MNADFWVALLEAEEAADQAEDQAYEVEAEARSEAALFGDAWPGAEEMVRGYREEANKAIARLAQLRKMI